MKTISKELQEHLDSGSTSMIYCWRIIRTDGVTLGFTEHDMPVTFGGVTYLAQSGFTASAFASGLGLGVDNTEAAGATGSSPAQFGVVSSDEITEDDLAIGRYDNARVDLYWVNWQNPEQRTLISSGNIGEIERTEYAYQAEMRSITARLQQHSGRTYQKTCDATLGDGRCMRSLVDLTHAITITGRGDDKTYTIDFDNSPDETVHKSGFFDLGLIEIDGIKYEIKRHFLHNVETIIELWENPPFPFEVDAKGSIIAGCNKFFETCRVKFDNAKNFQGFPHIPGNDTITKYAEKGEVTDADIASGKSESLFKPDGS